MRRTLYALTNGTGHGARNVEGAGEKYFITTAINYTNGRPHVGHAYEAVLADVLARFKRLEGRDVFFLTGSDEHGQKIANRAAEEGMEPKEYCDVFCDLFKILNAHLNISNDHYVRTTDERHMRCCQALWTACAASNDIYLDNYEGWYNEREECFVPEQEAELSEYKDPTTGTDLKRVTEECYFFRLSKYQTRLIDHIVANPDFIQPLQSRSQILDFLKEPLRDLCISRTAFSWGVPTPDAVTSPGHVMYVWFDALTNYLSASGGCREGNKWWPADVQIVGKDITRFHGIYWPAMLWSAGMELPKNVYSHGFVCDSSGKKMSKSVGNVVCPEYLITSFPVDSIRFYLCAESGSDVKFSEEGLVDAHNQILADTLGNLTQRGAVLCEKYFDGVVPAASGSPPFDLDKVLTAFTTAMEGKDVKSALSISLQACRDTNKWLTTAAPWAPDNITTRPAVIGMLLSTLYALTHFFLPFLPSVGTAILSRFALQGATYKDLLATPFEYFPQGHRINPGPWETGGKTLFPKFEVEKKKPSIQSEKKNKKKNKKEMKVKSV